MSPTDIQQLTGRVVNAQGYFLIFNSFRGRLAEVIY